MRRGYRGALVPVVVCAAFSVSAAPAAKATARVTLLTDSAGGVVFWHQEAREELGRGFDLKLEVATCRRLVTESCSYAGEKAPSALEIVESKSVELGQVVVVAVGYNEGPAAYGADLDRVMRALAVAGVEKVVWLTLRELRPLYEETNLAIREGASRWPSMVLADWNAVSKGQDSWFVDGIHMSREGGFAFVRWLRPIVLAACGPTCSPLPAAGSAPQPRLTLGSRSVVGGRAIRATLAVSAPAPAAGLRCSIRSSSGAVMAPRLLRVPGRKALVRFRLQSRRVQHAAVAVLSARCGATAPSTTVRLAVKRAVT